MFLTSSRVESLKRRERKSVFAIDTSNASLNTTARLLGLFTSASLIQCVLRCKLHPECVEAVVGDARECLLLGRSRNDGNGILNRGVDKNRYNLSLSLLSRTMILPAGNIFT